MLASPGSEFVPLEPPLTPRDEPIHLERGGVFKSGLSPQNENDITTSATRLTPGPVREWVFRDDEVSADTRSSTTEPVESSQDEDAELGKGGGMPNFKLSLNGIEVCLACSRLSRTLSIPSIVCFLCRYIFSFSCNTMLHIPKPNECERTSLHALSEYGDIHALLVVRFSNRSST